MDLVRRLHSTYGLYCQSSRSISPSHSEAYEDKVEERIEFGSPGVLMDDGWIYVMNRIHSADIMMMMDLLSSFAALE